MPWSQNKPESQGIAVENFDFNVYSHNIHRDVVALWAKPQKPVLQGQKTKQL